MTHPLLQRTRRHFFQDCGVGVGAMALASLMERDGAAAPAIVNPTAPKAPHFAPKATSVIFLFMAGGPSQLELWDHKPQLNRYHGEPIPQSFLEGRRFAFMDSFTRQPPKLLGVPPPLRPRRPARHLGLRVPAAHRLGRRRAGDRPHGADQRLQPRAGQGLPQHRLAAVRPARDGRLGPLWTGQRVAKSARLRRPAVRPAGRRGGSGLWASGFLPTTFQGVPFRNTGEPILNLSNPEGLSARRQRQVLDVVRDLNTQRLERTGDAEIATRISAYEMAFRMQTSAPELIDVSGETQRTLDMYGTTPGRPSFANNCLLARRLVERGVRFIQLYHTDWDHHGDAGNNLTTGLDGRCREVDQPCAALIRDLKQHGLLENTLVIWGGEFGRTPMGENRDSVGRNHHIDAYTMWFAGGGIKPCDISQTDEFGFGTVEDRVHVHDVQATALHLLGLDHRRLTFRFQGRDYRLTDVHGELVRKMLA